MRPFLQHTSIIAGEQAAHVHDESDYAYKFCRDPLLNPAYIFNF